MARKLIRVGIILSLLVGSSAGALAACPHVGCATTAAATEHDEHADARHQESSADLSGHADRHDAHAQTAHDAAPSRGVAANPHDPSCAHCANERSVPPSRSFKWQVNYGQAGRVLDAPREVEQVPLPSAVPVREFAPRQHAPPGNTERHLLLNVFRI